MEEIMLNDSLSKREKIDELFRLDSYMYTNLGIDSTDEERNLVKEKSLKIYKYIKLLDDHIGNQLLSTI